jgi:molybdopterin-guanine dinucleotide biosynthesis protein A
MGGVDKGLQLFSGKTLAEVALGRLRQQVGGAPGLIAINANRNQTQYSNLGVPVWPDTVPDYAGPLAGFLTGMRQCEGRHKYLLTVPCDSPLFPLDLLSRLSAALVAQKSEIAMAMAPELQADGCTLLKPQPVFCLMQTDLADSLQTFIDGGGRKIGAWTSTHKQIKLGFNAPGDDARAFANTNTLEELHALENP